MDSRRIAPVLIAALLAVPTVTRGNTYSVVIDHSASWSQAQTAAALAGGYLATITSPAEQAAVQAAIAAASPVQNGGFWINLRETSECCYIWDNGEKSCYANFYQGEPNNGGGTETRGQIMWNLTDASRRGGWNDVPPGGLAGTTDISRGGYVIEFGPADSADVACGACIRVSPNSFCNNPPPGSTVTTTQVSGVSAPDPPLAAPLLAARTIERTIIDISPPPPQPSRVRWAHTQATFTVTVPVPGVGVPASAVVAAFIDSINRVVGSVGYVANYLSLSDNTIFRMYKVGTYTSSDANNVPGITVSPYSPGGGGGGGGGVQGPMLDGFAQLLLLMMFSALATRALRARRGTSP